MWRHVSCVMFALFCGLFLAGPVFSADEPTFDKGLGAIGAAKEDDPMQAAIDEAGVGDGKEFTIRTDTDLDTVKVDDMFTNGQKGFFKVVSVDKKGGSLVVKRTAGNTDPGDKLNAVGTKPLSIVARRTMLDNYHAGGWPMHFIAGLGVLAILMMVNSVWIYRYRRQCNPDFIEQGRRLLAAGNVQQFDDLSLRSVGLLPQICRAIGVDYETSSFDEIQRRVEVTAAKHVNRLRLPVKVLNFCAAAAPLLGLFGTIIGMILVFEAVASAAGAQRATALATGIRVKLFCTAFALSIAIPSLLAYFIANQVFTNIVAHCEVVIEQYLHQIALLKRAGGAKAAVAVPHHRPASSHEPTVATSPVAGA